MGKWRAVQKRSPQQPMAKALWHPFRIGDEREEIRLGIHMRQGFGDTLSASLGDEPVMDNCNSHSFQGLQTATSLTVSGDTMRFVRRESGDYQTFVKSSVWKTTAPKGSL